MQTLADKILNYHFSLKPYVVLPDEIEWLYPYEHDHVRNAMTRFFTKYFSDQNQRTILLGINPGRFGAGITGIPFTDPIRMETACALANQFPQKQELSSVFVYEFINALRGVDFFYNHFYITSICPLGFVRYGKNYNYYDSPALIEAIMPMIIDNLQKHISFGIQTDVAFSMGQGKNFTFLEKLNNKYKFFKKLVPLPHPRWVMQYRLKRKEEYIQEYVTKLSKTLQL